METIESPTIPEIVADNAFVTPGRGWSTGNTNSVKSMVTIAQQKGKTPFCGNGSFYGFYNDLHNQGAARPRPTQWNPIEATGAFVLIRSGSGYVETQWDAYQRLGYYSGAYSASAKWAAYPRPSPSYEALGVWCHA